MAERRRYLIMLAADAGQLVRTKRFRGRLLLLGRPIIERAGVLNRRVCWAHDFPAGWPDGLRSFEFEDGDVTMNLVSTFPTNWRFPVR